jgi:DNA-binding response OmpR family regulator
MKVLVADDNADTADSISAFLEIYGHVVCTAYDGEEACRLADAFHPEAAVLDIRMPGKDGFAVAQTLRSLATVHAGCMIAVSGETAYSLSRFSQMSTFDHFLSKPASPHEIVAILSQDDVNQTHT